MATHTPGPWKADLGHDQRWQIHNEASIVATVDGAATRIRYPDADENAANAHMIAASPDLCAALQALLPLVAPQDSIDVNEYGRAFRAARAALAKAVAP